jgi:hypothetical protein
MLMERLQQHVTPHTSINVSLDDFPYYLEYALLPLSAYPVTNRIAGSARVEAAGKGLVWAKSFY